MEHALVRGDVCMLDDPLRAQSLSLTAGCVLAVMAIAVCAVLAFLQPRGDVGDAAIVIVRESGALYVRVGDTMHPALNLASARLITGVTDKPQLVSAAALGRARRGPVVGIPGAPDAIGVPLGTVELVWTVCEDDNGNTTVLAGTAPPPMYSGASVLVAARGESAATTYLLYDGHKARVDLRNPAVVRALKIDGLTPQPVSRALLDAVPEVPDITTPVIPRVGTPSVLPGLQVGTVVRSTRAESAEHYVVLGHGVQRVGEVAADLISFAYAHRRDIVTVAPGLIGNVPIVDELPVAAFPDRGGVAATSALCIRPDAVLTSESLSLDSDHVQLAQADGAGPGVDGFSMPAGRSAFVRATGLSGEGAETGALYLVDDSGVVFGIRDEEAAGRLGLSDPVPAPWPLLARLPRGPELSVEGASVGRDTVGPTP